MNKPINRNLGNLETAWAQVHNFEAFNTVSVLRLVNGPPPAMVQQALKILQARQPLLRVWLDKRGSNYHFREAENPGAFPLTVIPRQNDEQWHLLTEDEMAFSPNLSQAPLARCLYLYNEGQAARSELVFICHHSIYDAASGVKFLGNLLSLCAAGWAGEPLPRLEPLAPLPPLEDLFPPDFHGFQRLRRSLSALQGQLLNEFRYRRQGIDRNEVPNDTPAKSEFITIRLSKSATTELVKRTRQKRITLNAALNAAVQLATLKHRYARKQIWLRGATFSNLRPYLNPPLSADYLGAYFSMIPYTLPVCADDDYWQLAGQLHDIFYRASKSGHKFIFAVLSKYMTRFLLGAKTMRLGSMANSYVGAIDLKPAYGPIRVVGLHGFAVNNVLGPQCSVFSRILFGKLSCDMIYMDTDMNRDAAQTLGNEIQQLLEKATC